MSTSDENSNHGPLQPEDLAVLESLERGGYWLRAVLSTLARRGVAFRQQDEQRARRIIDELSTSPLYKSGQFLFDLLELEDFIVDGPLAETISTTLDASSLKRLATLLNSFKRNLDGAVEPISLESLDVQFAPIAEPEDLPVLEAGFYLYEDVVLGLVRSLGQHLVAKSEI